MVIQSIGCAAVIVNAFLGLQATFSQVDFKCRIGLAGSASLSLLLYDIVVNFFLTGVFIWLLRPLLQFHRQGEMENWRYRLRQMAAKGLSCVSINLAIGRARPISEGPYHRALNENLVTAVERLVWKSLIGCIVVVLPTIVNLSLLYAFGGEEQGWLCFTICIVDGKSSNSKLGRPRLHILSLRYISIAFPLYLHPIDFWGIRL
jgi:hypothetical protein